MRSGIAASPFRTSRWPLRAPRTPYELRGLIWSTSCINRVRGRTKLKSRTSYRIHSVQIFLVSIAAPIILWTVADPSLLAQDAHFHDAPASSSQQKNPYAGQPAAASAGKKLYATNCGSCHGIAGRGVANFPALNRGVTQSAPDGEVFWFITTGSPDKGMPSWGSLPEQKRWQLVTYLKSLKNSSGTQSTQAGNAGGQS